MSARPVVGEALRVFGRASLLTGLFAGGIEVAFDLEEDLLGHFEDVLPRSEPPAFYDLEGGGMGFTLTTSCGAGAIPPFAWGISAVMPLLLAPFVPPLLLASTLPLPRPIRLLLRD